MHRVCVCGPGQNTGLFASLVFLALVKYFSVLAAYCQLANNDVPVEAHHRCQHQLDVCVLFPFAITLFSFPPAGEAGAVVERCCTYCLGAACVCDSGKGAPAHAHRSLLPGLAPT